MNDDEHNTGIPSESNAEILAMWPSPTSFHPDTITSS